MPSFTDQVALVTGSSRGIGAATAKVLGDRGAKVVVNFHTNAEAAASTAEDIRSAGGDALVVQADVREADDVRQMVDHVEEKWDTIDVLVNNANMPFTHASIDEMTWSSFEQKLTDELEAAFRVTKAVVPGMVDQQYGRAIYVSSGLGEHPAPGFVAHGTAKAGLDAFAKYVAQEFGSDGITANVVAPGLVETDATADRVDMVREQVASETPLGRVAQPEDVATTIAALASDDATFVTGTYTPVNGGNAME
ncbi:SDR family NAD(P)-dependent oxidoreductase [Halanaeroarchaeum sulfurireducens]|uniref:3-oxoacyl-[acyl-carrier protein] reductase n=1 Tax=Halanaeroarchaeum sulfurireducens TaxID=1604004 RepID=A0A0F7PBH7_9EURY|nr:SDR family oxidoreductase [Halanaeroarchaeum sulfurireducens]AKH97515.1 3-oxoacyl-[acyl-carrier protein] reductase [Halanaeroarchaeum sulfurireducens]ALG81911.1 3-oxoacyl-[acyl-carrier protein] reductase [Halanaeroarchaeum sulfurireducens]